MELRKDYGRIKGELKFCHATEIEEFNKYEFYKKAVMRVPEEK